MKDEECIAKAEKRYCIFIEFPNDNNKEKECKRCKKDYALEKQGK